MSITLEGKNNRGAPRQEWADKIADMDDEAFEDAAKQAIWLSAYAHNNPRSDYHWQADACHSEAERRGKPEIYSRAWKRAAA